MDHEFNNRISAQRKVLQVINQKPWLTEPLFGLSSKAIDRWIAVNRIDLNSAIVKMIKDVTLHPRRVVIPVPVRRVAAMLV